MRGKGQGEQLNCVTSQEGTGKVVDLEVCDHFFKKCFIYVIKNKGSGVEYILWEEKILVHIYMLL